MVYNIITADNALNSLQKIFDHLCDYVDVSIAQDIVSEIYLKSQTLSTFPERGFKIRELGDDDEHRQILYDRYRIIYKINGNDVVVKLILDGRMDLDDLLKEMLK